MTQHITILSADLETPVGLYLKVRDLYPCSALLESSDYHTSQNSMSLIGVDPIGSFTVLNEEIICRYPDGTETRTPAKDVTSALRDYIQTFSDSATEAKLFNGLFGFTSYDAVRYFEPSVPIQPKEAKFADIPDMQYLLYRFVIQMNHFRNELTIIENVPEDDKPHSDELVSIIRNNNIATYPFRALNDLESTVTDEEFEEMVAKGIAHARRGDVFQIVPSRRFSQGFTGDEFNVYRALRSVNPSPYLFFFDFGSFKVFGSSPETHLRVTADREAYIDPIAGTFRRTGDDKKDRELAELLLKDPKENAEHIMLVDLARNDLSRSGGKVSVEYLKQIQFYSHVIHMVSRVKAQLPEDADVYRLFGDTFPAGTLSGAPKVRAMQIINELEPHSRVTYAGCIGTFGFDGSINQAITIRSFLSKDNRLYSQAGAGVVARSIPHSELCETNNKLGALVKAVAKAESFNA
ncbi:anthranilate synthase component I family protein [Lepagella muris]|jgi:anthranilate synthase component 1|uniref:Anthranilate synthase component I family protein n=1 Tax=Lepagella muris TaxID=3032870 RepID=A0AC61RJB3_9BACT|nr:chorismate-binding protein [Lepagella muris]ROT07726.1 anthranilate synthase component I family protein [Muribaculaceae bacterium Isolate-037 (Harlan)]TGY78828.1 anthranilate synthase component I family protein [Lepagella muris]THG52268.1 anthranilate synthase component I family protein [Bacteroidales bacterium]TKC60502.1 anthranilate synthase component I family protein [Bacteroidales bacterium]